MHFQPAKSCNQKVHASIDPVGAIDAFCLNIGYKHHLTVEALFENSWSTILNGMVVQYNPLETAAFIYCTTINIGGQIKNPCVCGFEQKKNLPEARQLKIERKYCE